MNNFTERINCFTDTWQKTGILIKQIFLKNALQEGVPER